METHQDAAPVLREKLPEHAAHLATEPELAAAWNRELAERKSQAAKVESLLAYKARKLEANKGQHSFTRRAVEKAVTRDAATALGLTEATVRRLLGTAEFLTEKLPKTWETYRTGQIDRENAAKAAQAVEDIAHRKDLLPVIDAEIAERAPGENADTVQKWATRRVAELDAAGYQERYDRAQGRRHVNFRHLGNGMSRIEALIPTLVAAQIEQQIHAQARNAPRIASGTPDSENDPQERTLSHRIADAFIGRLQAGTSAEVSHPNPLDHDAADSTGPNPAGATNLKIGILVPVQTLTGDCDAPAISWDRTWSLPAGTIRQIALDPGAEHDWYIAGTNQPSTTPANGANQAPTADIAPEILTVVHPRKGPSGQSLDEWIHGTDPHSDNLLARTYQSRTARDRQRDAVLIRDGQCTSSGCSNPGWEAEIDHTQSFETGGETTGENLKVLCRDCHNIKSHRIDHSGRSSPEHKPESIPRADTAPGGRESSTTPARASPTGDDLPEWLIETRPPPDWAVPDVA